MAPKKRAQIALDENPLDDPQLAKLLDDREGAKEELQPYRDAYVGLDKQVKAAIEQKELEDGVYRCGFFVITIKEREEREANFTINARRSVLIKPAKT